MATYYEFPLNQSPNPEYVNTTSGAHYLAWQLGRDTRRNLGIWIIEAVTDSPVPLNTVIPIYVGTGTLTDDVQRYGYVRSLLPQISITQLLSMFNRDVIFMRSGAEA